MTDIDWFRTTIHFFMSKFVNTYCEYIYVHSLWHYLLLHGKDQKCCINDWHGLVT